MRLTPLIFTLSLFTATVLLADTNVATSLLQDMSNTTEIATQTNQNIDYQPFILSVLQSDDLMKFGVHTLGEALTLVPGVDMAANTMNNRTPIFRGSNPTAYGQSILVIDGYVVNDHFFSGYDAYLDLPIELIERIEVVRGSGSFIEGVNGYAGTINVITHAQNEPLSNQSGVLFTHIGDEGTMGLGGWARYSGEKWKLSLDAFGQRHDRETPISTTDSLGKTGYANLGMEHSGFGVTYHYDRFELNGRFNNYKNQSAFGNLNALPNPEGMLQQPSWYLQSKYTLPIANDTTLILKASMMEDNWKSDSRPLPSGTYTFLLSPITRATKTVTFMDGYWASLMVKSRRINGGASLHYDALEGHHLISGVESTWDAAIDSYSITTTKTGLTTDIIDYTDTAFQYFKYQNAMRQSTNLYFSDTMTVNDQIAIAMTLGLIKTSDSDVGSDFYGRASLVYQPTYHDIFKLMGSSGNRLPSFQEMYLTWSRYAGGNPNLTHEHVHSLEAQYLRKINTNLTAGINLFYLINSQQIARDATGTFQNLGENTIHGGEAELRGKLIPNDTFSLSYSYSQGEVKDKSNHEYPLPYAASHLIKVAYAYDFANNWTIGSIWNYVGSKKRDLDDIRDTLAPYNTFDISLGWNMNVQKGWYAQAGIKDIGNTIVRYPAPANTYAGDYPIAERNFWIRAGWRF
ncbi:MAG: TonB-dependent receptor plug domain-containing protein [Campylobacterales bacterium]|nr:TonB-dependent receptor plug domain-containing protein [Campylobacterales bacterium]